MSDELIEAGKDISINALDTAISDLTDFFKGFPVVSSAITLLKALASIPDRLYVKKMYYFLSALKNDDMDSDTFSDAMNKLNKDETKFEETLLFIIEKAENTEKSRILGYFTRLLALGVIDYDKFILFTTVINNIQTVFLKKYSELYLDFATLKNSNVYNVLSSQGLILNRNVQMSIGDVPLLFETDLSEEGKLLGQYLKQYFEEK